LKEDEMNDKVMWKRIRDEASGIVKRKVVFHLTSDMPDNLFGATRFNDKKVEIFISMDDCKTVDMVIKTVSHELAHVILNNAEDSAEHQQEWTYIESILKKTYMEGEHGNS
jgi:hypothetical protein